MIKEGKIGIQEAIWLTTIAISSKVFFSSPAILSSLVGNAGWYSTLISAATALIGFMFIFLLLKRFPNQDIEDIFSQSLGRFFGFIFSITLATYLFFVSVTRISEFSEVLKVYVFPLSPNWFIIGIFIICIFTICSVGFESIARFSKLMIYIMLFGFVIIILLGAQNYDTSNLFPILGHGLKKTVTTGIIRSSAYSEVILLAIFARSLHGPKYIKSEGIISILLSGLLISVSLFAFTLTFPYNTSQEITAPIYEMATLIDYGRFLQRVEPIFLFIWVLSSLISASIIFYSFVWLFCKIFKITDKKPILLGSILILFIASLMHKDIISIIFGRVQSIREFGSILVFGMPLIALLVAWLRKKGGVPNVS